MDITVVGTHEYSVPPERGTIHLDVGFEGPELAGVLSASADLVNELNRHLEALRSGDAAPVTWHAVGPLGTRSWRPYNNQGLVMPLRHAASAHVQAKFRDFEALARFTGEWGARDGVRTGQVVWTLTDGRRTALESATLERAVQDARRRALVIARAAGAGEVEAVEVADPGLLSGTRGGAEAPQHHAAALRAAADSGESAAAVLPEDVRGTATVHARYRAVATPPTA